jgi:RNA recognition motif-containing protein
MSSTLYIDGLLASVGEQQLKGMFSTFGNVLSVDVYPPNMALSSGIGTVEMAIRETLRRLYPRSIDPIGVENCSSCSTL